MQQTQSGVLYFDDLEEFAFSVAPELGKSHEEQRDRIIYLKATVGGFIKDRARRFVKALGREVEDITRLVLTHIAITPFPVNQATQVQVIPFGEFAKSLFLGGSDEREALARLFEGARPMTAKPPQCVPGRRWTPFSRWKGLDAP